MENPISRIYQKMLEDLERLSGAWLEDFQKEMGKWTQDLLKGAFDPEKMMAYIKGMGIDMGQFSQMFSGMAGSGAMPAGFDAYQILGLDKSASDEEVKKRYRELLKKLHPDTSGVQGTEFLLQMVMAAYEMIKRERGWQ